MDPMADKYSGWSPYNYVLNNPIVCIDPNGTYVDGYQSLNGDLEWFDNEHDDWIYKNDQFYIKVSEDKDVFKFAEAMQDAGISLEISQSQEQGQITDSDAITSLEMWLNKPSNSIGEGISKIGANIGYSIINSPYSLITGQTIGGTSLNATEKMDAFVDVVPGLLSGGLTKTGEVVKTTKKGLEGFNQFVKKIPGITATEGLPDGTKWQQRAGQLFQTNKINQQGLRELGRGLKTTGVISTTKKELEKK